MAAQPLGLEIDVSPAGATYDEAEVTVTLTNKSKAPMLVHTNIANLSNEFRDDSGAQHRLEDRTLDRARRSLADYSWLSPGVQIVERFRWRIQFADVSRAIQGNLRYFYILGTNDDL